MDLVVAVRVVHQSPGFSLKLKKELAFKQMVKNLPRRFSRRRRAYTLGFLGQIQDPYRKRNISIDYIYIYSDV